MRIIIDTGCDKGEFEFANMGDLAMLQVAVMRLVKLCPSARLEVLTQSDQELGVHCPGAHALSNAGRKLWLGDGLGLGRCGKALPMWLVRKLTELKSALRFRCPKLLKLAMTTSMRLRGRRLDAIAVNSFVEAMDDAALVVVCGAGGFFDGCMGWNTEVLDLIEEAIKRNLPVAMLGQGIGPLTNVALSERIKTVFPKARLVTLRGHRGGTELLRSLGVPTSNIQTTGDEAIELGYQHRREELGRGLGLNFRLGSSAETDESDLEKIKPVLQAFARRHRVPMIPIPIAMHDYSRDDLAIKRLMSGLDDQTDGGLTLNTPLKVINEATNCRVLVTAAYHAAVFALAQGIPIVGLAKSEYFGGKLLGLSDQFGQGCEIVFLNDPQVTTKLDSALERSWGSAEKVREPLRRAAQRQIDASLEAYEQIRHLLDESVRN